MIVSDKSILELWLPVGKSLTFDKISPFVTEAENELAKVIGETFYNELEANDDTDPIIIRLIEKLQDSISFTAYYLGFDIINASFTNQGIHRIESENDGKKALFQRQEIELKNTFKRRGQNKLDDALLYLEKNKASFATWTASPEYTLLRANFINSTDDFQKHFNINNSRLVFLKIRGYQTLVEDFDVISEIGREYFDELKTEIASDTLTAANSIFLARLQKAVAHLTIYHGGYNLMYDMNEFGLYKVEAATGNDNYMKLTQLQESMFDKIVARAKTNGDSYLKACKSFLKENIADYPTYAASDAYDADGDNYRPSGTDKFIMI